MKRVFIIHGWEADPNCNWFPWLKGELEKNGFEAIVPAMPDSAQPKCGEWVGHLQKLVGVPDENTFFVGHSLGPIAILRYLESLSAGMRIGGAVLVAGFSESLGILETEDFFTIPVDFEKIKKVCPKFVAINSDDDPYVDLRHGRILEEKLGAELIVMHECGHLNAGNGFFELPAALEKILEMAG